MTKMPDHNSQQSAGGADIYQQTDIPRFESILLVTYGRSGSTLLQGILNAIPSILVRGENHNFCWGLFQAWKSLMSAKSDFGRPASASSTDAWYGAMDLNPELFLVQARELLKSQILPEGQRGPVCWGFKEIRYLDHLDELPAFLDFLSRLLPRPAIIFNTRDHDDVCNSAFWKRAPAQTLRQKLAAADRLFLEYAENNDHAFICRYERTVLGEQGLQPLFNFLGAQPDPAVLMNVLQSPHSFVPKAETLNRAGRKRDLLRLPGHHVAADDHPCRPDKSFKAYAPEGGVMLLSKVRDEQRRLPWFLEYYRRLGCRDFVFVDTGSQDGTIEYLRAQPDVFLYHAPASEFASSREATDWFNVLGPRHAMKRWILVADIDELLAWPTSTKEGLEALVFRAERLGLNRVFTPMIDVYPEAPCDTLPDYQPGAPFWNHAGLMDDVAYTKAFWDKGRLVLYSGPRARHAQPGMRPPIMSKQKLYYAESGGYQHAGCHFDTYGSPSPLVAPFLHFKFLPDFNARTAKAIQEGLHWNDAADHKQYAAAQLSSQVLAFDGSVDFRSEAGLDKYVKTISGLIRRSGMCGSIHWAKVTSQPSTLRQVTSQGPESSAK